MRAVPFLPILAFALAASPALRALDGGDARQGHALSRQVCSGCHAVGQHQVISPVPNAPTFVDLATTPGMTSAALTVAMTTPHAGMPMFRLTPEQQADIIAYILELRERSVRLRP